MQETLNQRPTSKWWAYTAIGLGTFTSVVDHGSVVVALPTIAKHFGTDIPTVQWVLVGYILAISALLLPIGRLSDIVGRKRVYIGGFVIFLLGAAVAGSAPNVGIMIVGRILQGAGAAMSQATGMAMLVAAFPSHERGKAIGSHISIVGIGAVTGPAVGGLLVAALGWQWVFYINIPLALIVISAALLVLHEPRQADDAQRPRFDWHGAALSAALLITLLVALTVGPTAGWGSPPIVAAMVGFFVLVGAFIWRELHTPAPMLDLDLFRRPLFSLAVSAEFISFLASSSTRFLMAFYLEKVLLFRVGQVGLIMVPSAISIILLGPLCGRLSDRYGWKKFNVGGMALLATGLFLLVSINERSPLGLVMAGMVLQSSAIGIFQSPNNSAILSTVEIGKYGVVAALTQLMRNSANLVSVAMATAIVTGVMAVKGYAPSLDAVSDAPGAFTSGVRVTFLVMGFVAVLGMALSFLKADRTREAIPSQTPAP